MVKCFRSRRLGLVIRREPLAQVADRSPWPFAAFAAAHPREKLSRWLLGVAVGLGIAAAAQASLAQSMPPQPHPIVTIRTSASSPPALSLEEVLRQPQFPSALAHYEALKAKAKPVRRPLPDWTGAWLNQAGLQFSPGYFFTDYIDAPLKEKYAKIYKSKMDDVALGREWDPLSGCLPAGYPRMLSEQRLFEFITTPRETWILQEVGNEAHRIYTDGRGHLPEDEAYPKWDGDAIGFWDDDTLIVHTNNLMATGDGYQRDGPTQSGQISTVEQWRMVSPDTVVLQLTVYDPEVLTQPWRIAPRFYKRAILNGQEMRPDYYNCAGSPVVRNADGTTQLILPGERGR
jgi:hypothetical protein